MNKKSLFFAFFISLNIVAAHGQETKDKKVKAPEKKSAAVKTVVAPPWNPDIDIFKFTDSLPKNYEGASAEAMVKWVLKNAPREKGEFEKQADYEQKISETEGLIKEKLYAFYLSEDMAYEKYDADKEVFLPKSYQRISFTGKDLKTFNLASNNSKLGSYVASNAYGKSVTVEKFYNVNFGVFLTKNDLLKTGFFKDNKYSIELNNVSIPIEKAKVIKASDISILVVGNIGVRNIEHTSGCLSPKIDSPYDGCIVGDYLPLTLKKMYIYHKPSGEVIAMKDIE